MYDRCRRLALETVDGAVIEDVAISNITMRNVMTSPIFLRPGRRLRGPAGTVPGALRRVLIDGIISSGAAQMPSTIAGIAGHRVEDVKIANRYQEQVGGGTTAMAAIDPPLNEAGYPEPDMFGMLPASGLFVREANRVEISHVELATTQADAWPVCWLRDVGGFDATGPRAAGRCVPDRARPGVSHDRQPR